MNALPENGMIFALPIQKQKTRVVGSIWWNENDEVVGNAVFPFPPPPPLKRERRLCVRDK